MRKNIRRSIKIGRYVIGDSSPVFIVAETGTNHNGNIEIAIKMIEAAKHCGADAIKFQTIDADASYIEGTLPHGIYKKARFTKEEWLTLKKAASENKIIFFSAPADIPSARILKSVRLPLIKISSGSMTNIALVREVSGYGIPVMISTGMSYLSEVKRVVSEIEKAGVKDIIILHCTSSYPADNSQLNLNAIKTLRDTFAYPIGYSDHTTNDLPSVGAVCLGARIIEKHFTIDKGAGGPEQKFSYMPHELTSLIRNIRCIETALGSSKKIPSPLEIQTRDKNRRCLIANINIKKGDVITEDMVGMKRPLEKPGLNTAYFSKIVGRIAARDIKKNSPIYSPYIKW